MKLSNKNRVDPKKLIKVGGETAQDGYILVDMSTWKTGEFQASVRVIDVINLADTDGLEGQISIRMGVVMVSESHKVLADSYGLPPHLSKLARATYVATCEDGITYQKEINVELSEDGGSQVIITGDTGDIDQLILQLTGLL
jgi:hypothetical protein